MFSPSPYEVLRANALLGEGIVWDAKRSVLWWTDIHGKALHRYLWGDGSPQVIGTPERVASFGLVAGRDELITAFESGIGLYSPGQPTVNWLARPSDMGAGLRFNDGRVDRAGRFWSGTMVERDGGAPTACLYSIDATAGFRCHVRGVKISNGLCTSPDGKLMYFADSPTRTIWVYDLVEPDGNLQNPRVFARTPAGAYPDGATVDTDGCVWSAHWGAGRVVRYTPAGEMDRVVDVPTRQPSCVCFGGPDLDMLCVTTARVELDAATLQAEPNAGDVFLYRTGAQGLPEPEYQL